MGLGLRVRVYLAAAQLPIHRWRNGGRHSRLVRARVSVSVRVRVGVRDRVRVKS